jgi:metal-responsive CopG/Arc/MetJ family transcriptional regulator
MDEKMLRTQIQLAEEQSRELDKLAAERHTSVAELIRQAAEDLLRETSTPSRAERTARARAAAGRFRSGKRDLSTAHDDDLSEIYGE